MDPLTQDDVIRILKLLEESSFDELHLEMGDLKLTAIRRKGEMISAHSREAIPEKPEECPASEEKTAASDTQNLHISPLPREEENASVDNDAFVPIKAPMLGTFYRAPKPSAPPFVEVGYWVTPDDTVCIIEVMKLFNTVKAGVQGRIAKVCADDAQMVEFNQTLFLVDAEASERAPADRLVS